MENIAIVKNQNYIVDIIDNGIEGEGIARIDNFTVHSWHWQFTPYSNSDK